MTEELDIVLRKSLDEVERARKRQWAYVAACGCCLAFFVFTTMEAAHLMGDDRLGAELFLGAVISVLTNILVVLGLSLFINRMTNKISKAIDLLSRK